jgi:hypothetical protein
MSDDAGLHVLVKYGALPRVSYNIINLGHWNIYTQGVTGHNVSRGWQEVARGTYVEMEALAKLMPEPKVLNFD